MSKYNPIPVGSVFNVNAINENNKKIAEILNDEVLFRKNPIGEPNEMKNDLDMNSKRVYNLPEPVLEHEAARKKDLDTTLAEASSILTKTEAERMLAELAKREAQEAAANAKTSEINSDKNINTSIAILQAAAQNNFYHYKTKGEALSATIPEGAFVQVFRDESLSDSNIIYKKEGGTLVYQTDLDILRKDLSNPSHGSDIVAFNPKGVGAYVITQGDKSRQRLHAEDYGFVPDGSDVTENALKLIHEAKIRRRPIEIGAGDFHISGSLDIAGLDFIGTRGGWKNEGGTRIIGDGSHHIFEQKAPMGNELNFSLRNIYVSGGLSAIYSRYGIFANVEDFFAEDVKQGVYLGTSSSYGPLWCNMRRVRIDATDEALLMDGNTVANANLFDTCFFKGGAQVDNVNDFIPAVRVRASGGYGALGNTFINSEFAGPGVGVSITSGAGNTFLGCYHEARGPQYHFASAPRSVKIISGIFAGSRNDQASPPCFIWHQQNNVNLSLDGGQIILGANDADQAGMSFFASQASGSINLDLLSNPVITGSATDFSLFGQGLPSNRVKALDYSSVYQALLKSGNGSDPSLGSSGIVSSYKISGGMCHVTVDLTFGSDFVASGQNWYFTLPPNLITTKRVIANGRIQRGSEYKSVMVYVNQSAASMFDGVTGEPLGDIRPRPWQSGDRLLVSFSYPLG